MNSKLFVRRGGRPGPTLLLLHGLACNAEVWQGIIDIAALEWRGSWVAADFLGHGRSGRAGKYSYGGHAADVAAVVDRSYPVTVLGHSMGGAVGIALGSGWYGLQISRVIALGVKVHWSSDEQTQLAAYARQRPAEFVHKSDAIQRSLRLAGLAGLVAVDSAVAEAGVAGQPGAYRPSFDPAANGIGAPPVESLLGAIRCPLTMACGQLDHMVNVGQLRDLSDHAVELQGLGHNAHVEDPSAVWELLISDQQVMGTSN